MLKEGKCGLGSLINLYFSWRKNLLL